MPLLPPFDSWDCQAAALPPRSRVHALEPIGIGSAYVEGLTGYVSRLADAHAVSVSDLVGKELSLIGSKPSRPFGPFVARNGTAPPCFHVRCHSPDGLEETAKRWVGSLGNATQQRNLRLLTLLPFEGILSKRRLFRRRRAWCPACYENWRRTGHIPYEPLLWAIGQVTICPLHKRLLKEVCPNCGESMKPLGPYGRPGYCSKCLEWLGDKDESPVDYAGGDRDSEVEPPLWRSEAVAALLATAPRLRSAASAFKANFRACIKTVAEGNACALAQASHVSSTAVACMRKNRSLMQLDTLFRICYHLNIPPTVFLENDPSAAAVYWQRAKETVIKGRERPLSWPPEQAQRVLREALREQPPPSLSEIARRLNYKLIERLYQIDRAAAKQIAANYRKSGRSHWWRKSGAERLCERVNIRQVLERSLAQEDPVNVHHIAASLGYTNEGYIQQKCPELCRAIREKCRIRKKARIARMELALKNGLNQDPPPTLREIAKRLGYSNSEILRRYFPDHYDKILAWRRLFRRRHIQKVRHDVRSALSEQPCPSLTSLCKRIGLCRSYLQELCPHEWALIRSRHLQTRRQALRLREEKICQDVRRIVRRIYSEGHCPSEGRVRALLPKPTIGAWRTIRAALKIARQELNLEH